MLILAKTALAMMIGFVLSITVGLILIPLLRKLKIKQNVSASLGERHAVKGNTPTMGGLIFLIPTIIATTILLFMNKMELTENLLIILFVFMGYAILGFIDDYLVVVKRNNKGLSELAKLFGQLVIALIFFYIFMRNGGEPQLYIYTLNIKINMGFAYGLFLLFVLTAGANSVNITDGLDGLAGGLSMIAFFAVGIIAWGSKWVIGYESIAIFSFILVGSLLGFLFFNTYPAKIFMGDTGALALGGTLAAMAIVTNHELTLVVIAGVFVIETLSVIIQRISMKLRHGKKVFLMSPLHHHFERLGWDERDIVKTAWVIGLILSMMAIAFGVWI